MRQANKNAQGALEYLLLIGGAVIVAAVVLTLLTGLAATGQQAAGARVADVLCAPFSRTDCGLEDPDGTGSFAAQDCFWNNSQAKCSASTVGKGAVLYIGFEEEDSTAFLDRSGSANNAVKNGGIASQFDSAKASKVGVFDGTDDYLETASLSLNIQQDLTISAWVNSNGTPTLPDSTIIMNGVYDYAFTHHTNKHVYFYINSGTNYASTSILTPPTPIEPNEWHHLVGTFKDNGTTKEIKLYLDGLLIQTRNSSFAATGATGPVRIGASTEGALPTRFYRGSIDNVLVHNRALSESEVKELYSLTR